MGEVVVAYVYCRGERVDFGENWYYINTPRKDMEVREVEPHELDKLVEFRNTWFPPVSLEEWRRDPEQGFAVAAFEGKEIVGAIPIALREFRIAPKVVIPIGFEHSVVVRPDMRSQGIGRRMVEVAAEALKDRCDALMVYRGQEKSRAYNFYRKAGHHDLHYIRPWSLRPPKDVERPGGVSVEGGPEVLRKEPLLLDLFERTYGDYGGFRERGPGYFERAFSSALFACWKPEIYLFFHRSGAGYALCLKRTTRPAWSSGENPLLVAEVAGEDDAVLEVLQAVAAFAAGQGWEVTAMLGPFHPLERQFWKVGFRPKSRDEGSRMILSRPIRPERTFARIWDTYGDGPLPEDLEVRAWTPGREFVLKKARVRKRTVTLGMKDDILARLLMCRLDLKAAVEQELMTVYGDVGEEVLSRICSGVPFVRWVHHPTDYI